MSIPAEDNIDPLVEEEFLEEQAERARMFHKKARIDVHAIRPVTSWLVVDEDGNELFRTQSPTFLEWWMDNHPTCKATEET